MYAFFAEVSAIRVVLSGSFVPRGPHPPEEGSYNLHLSFKNHQTWGSEM
jgi:hypothetical protein